MFANVCVRNRFNVFYTMLNEVSVFLAQSQEVVISFHNFRIFEVNKKIWQIFSKSLVQGFRLTAKQ